MKKAVNKSLLACITSFLLLFSCVFVCGDTVHAVDNGDAVVLGTMDARYADEEFKSYLAENGVEYVIENTVYDPVASRTYTQSRNMTSNLRIIYTNGGWNEGPWMSYIIRFSDGSSGAQDIPMS